MEANYVAKKSAWSCVSFLWIIACVLIIPLIIMIFRIIAVKHYAIEFYDDKIIIKSGWLNTSSKVMTFMGVTSTTVQKSLWGSLFNYGTVTVDAVGKWDVNATTYIKNPEALEAYLQTRIVHMQASSQHIHMGI